MVDLKSIEALAPDQGSLQAASKLMKPAKWPLRARDAASGLVFAECQGSGANPYRVIFDSDDNGYKCTCPSRKFPCKHVLALMWMFAETPQEFAPQAIPDWVEEWLGRRRKSGAGGAKPATAGDTATPAVAKSLATARIEAPEAPEAPPDPKLVAQREAQAKKRAGERRQAMRDGLDDLEQWIGDQLRLGLGGLLQEPSERCRRIAARLVDAKAQALAGRIDEMPSRLLPLGTDERLDAAISELGKLVLLSRAWKAAPDDAELERAVGTAETREQVLDNGGARRVTSRWLVAGEEIRTRRDGLVSQSTWLLDLRAPQPRFAQLLDFTPASAGKRASAFTAGEQFDAELAFYPAAKPLRAIVAERRALAAGEALLPWPTAPAGYDLFAAFVDHQDAAPWTLEAPLLLPAGRLHAAKGGALWWRRRDGDDALPVGGTPPRVALGLDLEAATGLWDGSRLRLLGATTRLGFIELKD